MTRAQILAVAAVTLAAAAHLPSRAADPPVLRIAYLSGNAGEIDPCG